MKSLSIFLIAHFLIYLGHNESDYNLPTAVRDSGDAVFMKYFLQGSPGKDGRDGRDGRDGLGRFIGR